MVCIIFLGQIMISNTRSKRVNDNMLHTLPIKTVYMQSFMIVCFGFHYNALFVLITISNTRSKRVNENITKMCTFPGKKKYTWKVSCLLVFLLLREYMYIHVHER